MAIVDTGLLTKGLRSEFFNRFEAAPAYYRDLATRVVSNNHSEVYRWLGSVPQLRRWGDGRLAKGLGAEQYSIENYKYESTLEVDRDELADDQTGQIRVRVRELADRAATHKDFLIGELLASGSEVGFNSYDGVPFFSSSHASGGSGDQSNLVSADGSQPNEPTVLEFKSSLVAGIARMMTFKDDQGEPMSLSADGLCCVVPPSMYFTALEAIHATVVNATSNVMEGVARVISFPWLERTDRWFLLKNNGVVRPFIFQDREPIEFTAMGDDSEEVFRKEKYYFGVRARYRIAYGYWQYAVQVNFEEA